MEFSFIYGTAYPFSASASFSSGSWEQLLLGERQGSQRQQQQQQLCTLIPAHSLSITSWFFFSDYDRKCWKSGSVWTKSQFCTETPLEFEPGPCFCEAAASVYSLSCKKVSKSELFFLSIFEKFHRLLLKCKTLHICIYFLYFLSIFVCFRLI